MANYSCLKEFSCLIDTLLEMEIDVCVEKPEHLKRMHQNELKLNLMFQLMDLLMHKLSLMEDKILHECLTCEFCSKGQFVMERVKQVYNGQLKQ